MSLRDTVFDYPAIDNHAHPLLKEEHRGSLPFEGVISEARPNAIGDAIHSLPGYRATRQLAELYELDLNADWDEIKSYRDTLEYGQLCDLNLQKSGIQCLLLDDGLRGQEIANDLSWHGRFTNNFVYRLVRVETVAEVRAKYLRNYRYKLTARRKDVLKSLSPTVVNVLDSFYATFRIALREFARDPNVVGFKSVVAYRTGLDVNPSPDDRSGIERGIHDTISSWKDKARESEALRLASKALNDFVVRIALSVATDFNKPGKYSLMFDPSRYI